MIKHYFKLAIRNLQKHKTGTIINISGIIVAFVSVIIICLYVDDKLNFNSYHKNLDEIEFVYSTFQVEHSYSNGTQLNIKEDIPKKVGFVKAVCNVKEEPVEISYENKQALKANVLLSDSSFLNIFTTKTTEGNLKEVFQSPDRIALSKKNARKIFGSKTPIGEVLELGFMDTSMVFTVASVFEDIPYNNDVRPEFIISSRNIHSVYKNYPLDRMPIFHTYARVAEKDRADFHKGLSALNSLFMGVYEMNFYAESVGNIYFGSEEKFYDFQHTEASQIISMIIIGIMLILIALINYSSFIISQIENRFRQINIQLATGAYKKQLVKSHLMESILICIIALPIALIIAEVLIPHINQWFDTQVHIEYFQNKRFLPIILTIVFLSGSSTGLLISLFMSRLKNTPHQKNILPRYVKYYRVSLLGIQIFFLSILGLFGYHIYSQTNYAINFDMGFEQKNIYFLRYDQTKYYSILGLYPEFKTELQNLACVEAIGESQNEFPNSQLEYRYLESKSEEVPKIHLDHFNASKDFFETLNIKLLQGKLPANYSYRSENKGQILLTEEAVKQLQLKNPIGKTYQINDFDFEVVGITENFTPRGVRKSNPVFFELMDVPGQIIIRLSSGETENNLSLVQDVWKRVMPEINMQIESLQDANTKYYKAELKQKKILQGIIIIILLIAIAGIYSIASQLSSLKLKEMGIRKVLGCQKNHLRKILLMEFFPACILANLLAYPVSYYLIEKWLNEFQHHISISYVSFVFSMILALLIVTLGMIYHINKAANRNPAEILRYE